MRSAKVSFTFPSEVLLLCMQPIAVQSHYSPAVTSLDQGFPCRFSHALPRHGVNELCLSAGGYQSGRSEAVLIWDKMASVHAAKRALRAQLKERLSALSELEKLRQSQAVTRKLLSHNRYKEAQRIAVFLNMNDEIQTGDIIHDIFTQGKACFIPRYQRGSNHMDMVRLSSVEEITNLPLTTWNIRQPGEGDCREDALSSGGLDLVLMPGLGFDKQGHRLGRGKGYYDTFLERYNQQLSAKPYTIALTFQEQLCTSIPVTDHDFKIDEILCAGELEIG